MIEHKHLIIRAEVLEPPTDTHWTCEWLKQLVENIGMKVCAGPISAYVTVPGNRGLTAVVIIETSHIAMHCWDEESPGLMQFDIYTCGSLLIADVLKELEQFKPTKLEYKFLDREHDLKLLLEERWQSG